jgi:hypothetical protein
MGEARNSGELDFDSTDSGDEDELTGIELLRDLEGPTPGTLPSAAPRGAAKPRRMAQESPAADHLSIKHRGRDRVKHRSG